MAAQTVKTTQYNPVAEKYAETFLKYNQESIDAYFRHFEQALTGLRILDLGCGNGYDLSKLKTFGAEIYGIDSSPEMVKLARLSNPDGVIEIGRFDEIPFPDKSFDLVISKWALQTNISIGSIYKEVARVLRSHGKLIYLACHPIRQFMEKKHKPKNYFKKEVVTSVFFDGQITALEPSHTLDEYLSSFFFKTFSLESFEEGLDSAAEKISDHLYPSYFIIKASLKS